jgi:pimeloyl-ACP methyl ester carboxylesterase
MTGQVTEEIADTGRGISLAYEQFGAADGEPVVLIMGLGQQMHSWPAAFCEQLAGRGYRVARFDNRDCGRSTHMSSRPPRPVELLRQRFPAGQYDLTDLATDTVGLLDALGYDSAHLVGASMGGMIAQTTAALWPQRVRTLTSIMSTTGARRIGRPALSTWRLMAARPAKTREAAIEHHLRIFRHIGSHGYPFDDAMARELGGLAWDRDPAVAAGTARQLAAILQSGDRTAQVRSVAAPTLVIHGDRDRMVNPTGGAATARAITGARLETITGMGHDMPRQLWPVLIDLIDGHASRGGRPEPTGSAGAVTSS